MAKKAKHPNKLVLDPMFAIPRGAEEDFVYSNVPFSNLDDALDFSDSGINPDEQFLIDTTIDGGFGLDTPEDFTVVSQTLRRMDDGTYVVDVVLNVTDVAGAIEYESQVTILS